MELVAGVYNFELAFMFFGVDGINIHLAFGKSVQIDCAAGKFRRDVKRLAVEGKTQRQYQNRIAVSVDEIDVEETAFVHKIVAVLDND